MKAIVVLLAVALIADGCGGGGKSAPHFRQTAGWRAIEEPGQTMAAANVPFAAADRRESGPTRTVASLPQRGVLIWAEWSRPRNALKPYRSPSLPLRVEEAARTGDPEGMACPPGAQSDCFGSVRHLTARESRWDFDIWIFFGTGKPPAAQVAAANAELARLRFS